MMRSLLLPKNAGSSGYSLGEKELEAYDDAFDDGVQILFLELRLPKTGWVIGISSSMWAATVTDHLGVSLPSGVLGGTMQQRARQLSVGL